MTIMADKEHFYKVSGEFLGKIFQMLEYIPENSNVLFVRLGELSEATRHEKFDEVK